MVSPIKVYADLSKGLNAWLTLFPNGARAIGQRLLEEYDYWRDCRRMRNIASAAALSLPNITETATAPDDDWMNEWFDLAGKRSYAEWQHILGKMLAHEANEPGSVPMRYFVDMTRLDQQVMAEFAEYCGWYVAQFEWIIKLGNTIPRYVCEANLIEFNDSTFSITFSGGPSHLEQIVNINGETIALCIKDRTLLVGNYRLTNFGKFVYTLLDPKPPLAPDLAQSLRELWQNQLPPDDTPAS